MKRRGISLIALSIFLLVAFLSLGSLIFWFVLPIVLPLYVLIFISAKRERRPSPATPSSPRVRESTPRRSWRSGGGYWEDMKRYVREAIEFSIELLTWARILVLLVIGFSAISLIFLVPYGPLILSIGLFLGIGIIQFSRRDSIR